MNNDENDDTQPYFQILFPEENNLFHKGTYDVIIKGEKNNDEETINIELKSHKSHGEPRRNNLMETDSNMKIIAKNNKI